MSAKLNALMDALVQELLDQVTNGTAVADKETGEISRTSTNAAVLNVARQFLKDHNIQPSKENHKVKSILENLPYDESLPTTSH